MTIKKGFVTWFCKFKSMSDKDFNKLMELAEQQLQEEVTPEEALRSLILAGILDESGNFTKPYEMLATPSIF